MAIRLGCSYAAFYPLSHLLWAAGLSDAAVTFLSAKYFGVSSWWPASALQPYTSLLGLYTPPLSLFPAPHVFNALNTHRKTHCPLQQVLTVMFQVSPTINKWSRSLYREAVMTAVTHFPFSKSVMVSRQEQKISSACTKFIYGPCQNTESSQLEHLNYIPHRNLDWVAGVQSVTISVEAPLCG